MRVEELPAGNSPAPLDLPHFPARWQAVVWRNWGLVPVSRLAAVLEMPETALRDAAAQLGLDPKEPLQEQWCTHCYLSVIRSNWHLLSYEQILKLLDWTPERMLEVLTEEDFFWSKLGRLKPQTGRTLYSELTDAEKCATREIRKQAEKYFPAGKSAYLDAPLAFQKRYGEQPPVPNSNRYAFEFNFIHSYAASCGDVFLHAEKQDPAPENLLAQYASSGVKGVWFHALLRHFYPVPGGEEYSSGREIRLKNLKKIVARLKKHGLKLYLYFNEPRCLPREFYRKNPEWGGWELPDGNSMTVCTTRSRAPLDWIEKGMEFLFTEEKDLGGIFSIVMSENPTNCNYASSHEKCPFCKNVRPEKILSDILKSMERGVHKASPEALVIAYDWAWRPFRQSQDNVPFKTAVLKELPDSVYAASVSEWGMITQIGGVELYLKDYSISQPGPSEESLSCWKYAKSKGMKTAAKIQINNSWELAAVPYLPVPYLIQEHLQNLHRAGVNGLILSWTLGGFPGGNLRLLHASPEEIANSRFHRALAEKICSAWKIFSESFREYPFHNSSVLYKGPCNYGPMNLLHLKKTSYAATMLGFPYDDLEIWRGPYPETVLETQFGKVSEGWKMGLDLLHQGEEPCTVQEEQDFQEICTVAEAAYCHLRSAYLQIRFTIARNHGFQKEIMRQCAEEELALAKRLHDLVRRDSRLGFEASNHYFYSLNELREKIISCIKILADLAEDAP